MTDITTVELGYGITAEISNEDVTLTQDAGGNMWSICISMPQFDQLSAAVSKHRKDK